MKKLFYIIAIMATSLTTFAQSDSIAVDTTKSEFEVYAGGVVASRNYARGVNFGSGLSIQPYAGMTYKGITLEFFAALTADGEFYDYGTIHDFSLSYETGAFKVGVHDYYFFSKNGNHNYFFETGSDTMNGHYYEAQVSYSTDKLSVLVAHNFYNTNLEVTGDYWKGVYLEGNYSINENFAVVVAGLTGPSIVNFYDAAGLTTVGLEWNRDIMIGDDLPITLDAKLHVNPNYKNISPGVQSAPMNFFVSFTF